MQLVSAQESFYEHEIQYTRLELKKQLEEIQEVKAKLQINLDENFKDSIHSSKELIKADDFSKTILHKRLKSIELNNKHLKKSLQELEYYERIIDSLLNQKPNHSNNSIIG